MRTAFTLLVALALAGAARADDNSTPVARIAFGSCCKQGQPQPVWDSIVGARPDLFIFLGDNIYGDSTDLGVLRARWAQLGAEPGYRKLKAACRILATWDDHDFGMNDGGAEYPSKQGSQQLFLDFFDEPPSSPRRKQEGVYDARVFGPAGKRVQVILLDTRYFRSPLKLSGVKYPPGPDNLGPYTADDDPQKTMLGPAQWNWLAAQLAEPADLRLIASSVQVIADEHHWEKWGNFSHERQRLLELIRSSKASGVILLSGDRHWAEVSRWTDDGGYPLYEVTSSSLNQPSEPNSETNRYRVGTQYFSANFGVIDIDWPAPEPSVRLQIRSETGDVALETVVKIADLKAK